MSLINDALKRAKEAQQQNSPDPPVVPPLRPVENDHRGSGIGLMLALILILLIVATGILLLQWIQMNRKTISASNAPSDASTPATIALERKPEPLPAVVSAQAAATTTQPSVTPAAAAPEVVQTNVPVVPPPKPEFKLQGISYRPGRSTALINGRTVRAGDRIGEARVAAIEEQSVTIVLAGQTNVLTFGEPY